jgi:serine/threonine protein kinase
MEQSEELENLFSSVGSMIEALGIQTIPNVQSDIHRQTNDFVRLIFPHTPQEEFTSNMGYLGNLINGAFIHANNKLKSKIVTADEYIMYKFIDDENICPKIKSIIRDQGKFLIKYKIPVQIDKLTEDKKVLSIKLIKKLHKIGIFHGNINKDNIVYDDNQSLKIENFNNALWIDEINDQFLTNNLYGVPCSTIDELLELELKIVDEI